MALVGAYRYAQELLHPQRTCPYEDGKDPTKVLLGCRIHCRRYFIAGQAEDEATAKTAIAAINKLYTIEHDADNASFSTEERKEKRLLPQSRCCISCRYTPTLLNLIKLLGTSQIFAGSSKLHKVIPESYRNRYVSGRTLSKEGFLITSKG